MDTTPLAFAALKDALRDARTPNEREEALRHLVQSVQPFIRRLAGRLIESRQRFDSEDIQQSVCLRLVRQLELGKLELRTEAEFFALLKTMVRNLVLDRQQQRSPQRSLESLPTDDSRDASLSMQDARANTPSFLVRADELRDALWAELAACLQPDELFLVREHWGKETPQKDLAARLGISEDAVRMRLQRARRKIRDRLGDECQWLFE